MLKYKAISKLDGAEVSFDREAWAQAAIKEGWIDAYERYDAPELVPESPAEIRIREIDAELAALDAHAQRPLCSVMSGLGSEDDALLLAAIEGMKIDLREERRLLLNGPEDDAEPNDVDDSEDDDGAFLLNTTGSTYHYWECSLAKTGKKMTLAEIADKYPDAAPCATCCPPAFTKGS